MVSESNASGFSQNWNTTLPALEGSSREGAEKISLEPANTIQFFFCAGVARPELDALALETLTHWTGYRREAGEIFVSGPCVVSEFIHKVKAMVFIAQADGGIPIWVFHIAQVFFHRDGAEALVFEFDRFKKIFVGRDSAYFDDPNRIIF